MPTESDPDLDLEIAHVLLIDIVGYSKLLVNEQIEVLQQLNQLVRNTPQFRGAEAKGKLMRLPTGDGMALLFFESAETPVRCALEISQAAKEYPRMGLRMGAHQRPDQGGQGRERAIQLCRRWNQSGAACPGLRRCGPYSFVGSISRGFACLPPLESVPARSRRM